MAKPTRTNQIVHNQAGIARIAVPAIPIAGTDPSIEASPPEVELVTAAELAEDRILLALPAADAEAEERIDKRLEESENTNVVVHAFANSGRDILKKAVTTRISYHVIT